MNILIFANFQTILEQTKKEAQKYLNGTIKSQFNVDEMGKIVNIHGKMPEKIQLENIKREGFKVLENELKTLKKEKKNQMDAELAKLKEKNDKQIKGLKENTNYKDRVTSIMDEFELKKKKLNE
jgi:hypothetical protein